MLATYAYDDLGRTTSVTFGNGVTQGFGFDPVSRLASLTNDLAAPAEDLSATFSYNPASQINSTVRTGDSYAWTGHFNENTAGTANGLNQLTSVGAKALSHDSKGNVTAFGTKAFTYSSENLLLTGPGSSSLAYDPLMRLRQVTAGATATYAYDGIDRIAEYDGASALQRRYVHGPGADAPMVWYEGADTSDRRFLSADERGSIIAVTDTAGALLGINAYDEYGQPQSTNLGAFGYTGQAWLPTIGEWYYKARVYEPELGRFLQPDPVGYGDSPNLYAYVLNDAVNYIDPTGLTLMCSAGWSGLAPCSWQPPQVDISEFGIGGPGPRRPPSEPEGGGGERGNASKGQTDTCPKSNQDTSMQNYADERKFFDQVAAASDLVAISAAAATVVFPPAAGVAALAKGFSTGATLVGLGFATAQSIHSGNMAYIGGALTQAAGGFAGGRIARGAAFGKLANTQLRVGGKFGPNAFKAYGNAIERGGKSLGSATAGVGICTDGR